MTEQLTPTLGTNAHGRLHAALSLFLASAVCTAVMVLPVNPSATTTPQTKGAGDSAMYDAVIQRLRSGESYYRTLGSELHERGYATYPEFNWRTPLVLRFVAVVGDHFARAVLIALALLVCAATHRTVDRGAAMPALLAQLGVLATVIAPVAVLMGEAWCGLLIALSTLASVSGRHALGVGLGVLALFARELAAPYCVAASALAIKRRRYRESVLWMSGALLYATYYVVHLQQVWNHQLPPETARHSFWLRFGGLEFVAQTIHWQGALLLLPWVFTALSAGLITAGVATRLAPSLVRLTSLVYLAFFVVAGQSFNVYWGLVAWPSWALAVGFGTAELGRALPALFRRD